MTERKVLNKYFPPDFDPSKIPHLKGMKREKIFCIRTMAPFNMLCLTCKQYIFKAKKFNSRMEESEHTYIGLKEFKFTIRCPTCCAEIVYRTDKANNDYLIESGAKRSFEAYTTARRLAFKEEALEKEELLQNPIKAMEKSREESHIQFKQAGVIQDLIEQSKNDGTREDMINDTIAMLQMEEERKGSLLKNSFDPEAYVNQIKTNLPNDKLDIEKSCPSISRYLSETEEQKEKKTKIKALLAKIKDKNVDNEDDGCVAKQLKLDCQSNNSQQANNIFGLDYSDSD